MDQNHSGSAEADLLAGGRLTIDLGALAANWQALAARSGDAATAAVVKGDAYGIGIEQAALALAEAGCHTFFVALPEEGLRLRAVVNDAAIYILDGLMQGAARIYRRRRPPPGPRLVAGDRGVGGLPPFRRDEAVARSISIPALIGSA